MSRKALVWRAGNSLVVTLPKSLTEYTGIKEGTVLIANLKMTKCLFGWELTGKRKVGA